MPAHVSRYAQRHEWPQSFHSLLCGILNVLLTVLQGYEI